MLLFTSRSRWCGRASVLSAALISGAAAWAAEPLTETTAIERALSRPEFTQLGEAEVDEAEARVSGIRRFDNPEANVSREQVSGARREHAGVDGSARRSVR